MTCSISVHTLLQLLTCDAAAGKLWWRERSPEWFSPGNVGSDVACRLWNQRYAGREALINIGPSGYRRGTVLDTNLQAHRVIWAMTHGAWPSDQIDHINGVRDDNRIANLREVTQAQNKANSGKRSSISQSRYIGVRRVKGCRTFIATVGHERRNVYVGSFRDEAEAARARDAVAKKLKGDFARLNFPEKSHV